MNCQDFRARVGAEPGWDDPQAAAHEMQCAQCAQFRQQLQAMDRLVYRALQVPVSTAAPRRTRRAWRAAASLLLASTVAASIWLLQPRDTFAQDVVTHVRHEAFALVRTPVSANPDEVAQVLAKAGLRLKPGIAHVSYASSCWFRGHFVPHLVVQSEQGPITVLVLPHEAPPGTTQRIEEDGFDGSILPAPRGVVVILGEGVPVAAAAETIVAALDYATPGRPDA